MATEVASAYVALYTKMPGVAGDIQKNLGGADVKSAVDKAGKGFGSTLMDGLNSLGKVGAIALGGTLAAGVGTALVKGFNRLDALDQAEAKLKGLGHSASTIDTIMDNAMSSVRGTAFGFGDAAQVAANAVAAGIKPGEDLARTLTAVADASTIAGVDMGSMGAIFNKVAASNKVQMDVINQLHDAGVPALALLADQMGVTAEEAAKMASAGEIDFATFQAAMESGMGGAALESGNTFSGAMDNVMASLGRIGEGLLSGIFPDMKDGLSGLIDAMAPLEEVAKNVGAAIGEFFGFIRDNISWIGPLATGIAIAVGAIIVWTAVQWLLNAALTANPIGLIIVAIGLLIGAIILLVQNWDTVVAWITEVWQGFVTWFTGVMDGFLAWWNGLWTAVWEWIVSVWNGIVSWITGVLEGFLAWWNGLWGSVGNFINTVWNNIKTWITQAIVGAYNFIRNTLNSIRNAWEGAWNGIGNFLRDVWNNILGWIEGGVNGAIDLINGMLGGLRDVAGFIGIEIGTIGHISIPRLAQGGIVTGSSTGTLALVGEGGYGRDEAVIPLPEGWRNGAGFGPSTLVIVDADGQLIGRMQVEADRRIGRYDSAAAQATQRGWRAV